MRAALRHARLQAERRAVAAAIPTDPSPEIAKLDLELRELRRDRTRLLTGQGRYAPTPVGHAARRYLEAREKHADAQRHAHDADHWRDRRHWRKETDRWANEESAAETAYVAAVGPELNRLDHAIGRLVKDRDQLETARQDRTTWLADHPEAACGLRNLDLELNPRPETIQNLGPSQTAS